ncbi:YbjN domain-containing protein [Cupriavidus sp. YAF13]|uniref:YbjN domain-containing protein n=1 Tax=Cupriavidus sp. YAF13 TaxID=3233075 RepID=UPI003F93D607
MTKTFTEADITIETLDAHLRDSGLVPYAVKPDAIRLRSENGIGYRISLITDWKFIRFHTYLPLDRQAPIDQKHALAKRLNEQIFLPVFTVDADEDLTVVYVLPYAHGLIAGNFVSIVTRFASLLEFIVQTYNDDGLIDFGGSGAVPAVADASSGPASGGVLH